MTVVLLGLYPTVLLTQIYVEPHTQVLGHALMMLVSNLIGVVALQWAVTPALQKLFGPWLRAGPERGPLVAAAGYLVVLCLLTALVFVFRQWHG